MGNKNNDSLMKDMNKGYFSQKELMKKALFMNNNELQGLLDRVNRKINKNKKIDDRLMEAQRRTKYGVNYDMISKYQKNL